jgi:RNA 3'-terminal phosphate cyclase
MPEKDLDPRVAEKMIDSLASLLAELGACPPMKTSCPQRGKPISIKICSECLRTWAKAKAKGD